MNNGEKNETDPRKIADAFNDYFINFNNIQEKIPPTRKHFSDYLKQPSANSFFVRPIKVEEITKIITNLDPKTHNLITITETIRNHLDRGEFSCAVFLDLQKALDSVDHEILLKKMEHYGFRGKAK